MTGRRFVASVSGSSVERRQERSGDPETDFLGVFQDDLEGSENCPPRYICEIMQQNLEEAYNFKRLVKWPLQRTAKNILGWKRLCECHSSPHTKSVDVLRSVASQRAFFTGLDTCGSVWVCPVCGSKITERKRLDLEVAIERALNLGLNVHMQTLTAPHRRVQRLGDLLDMFGLARRRMKNVNQWKSWAKLVGLVGSIRSLEVTHGFENGWHVHTHDILICRSSSQKNECVGSTQLSLNDKVNAVVCPVSSDVLPMWQKACLSAGLDKPNSIGVDIRAGNNAVGDYVSKWGISAEMTKSHVKKGHGVHRTPWDILNDCFEKETEIDAELFREYAKQFKGKRQLVWSDGLRDLLGMTVEKTDEEIAAEPEKADALLASIDLPTWRKIIRSSVEIRGQVLLAAEAGQLDELLRML